MPRFSELLRKDPRDRSSKTFHREISSFLHEKKSVWIAIFRKYNEFGRIIWVVTLNLFTRLSLDSEFIMSPLSAIEKRIRSIFPFIWHLDYTRNINDRNDRMNELEILKFTVNKIVSSVDGKSWRENGQARGFFEAYRGCVEAEVTPKAGKHIMTSIAGWRYILRRGSSRLQAAPESSVRPVIVVSQKVHGKRLLLRHASLPRVETLN